MDKISFCIPTRDNLRYLKTCIASIRENAYRKDHDIIIFVDESNDGTVEWLLESTDKYNLHIVVNPDLGESLYGIGKAYDECIKLAETDIVMIFHADMILGKNADLEAFKHLSSKSAVCSTRVEPPLHPNAGEKILRNFGMYPEEFSKTQWNKFIDSEGDSDKVTAGIFAPWMVYKKDFLDLGGHDYKLHSCREDSDLFNRMSLDGWKFKQVWSSLVYHFAGRGAGSFSEDRERHNAWQIQMQNSTKEFIRKWGTNVMHSPMMLPQVAPYYDKGIVVANPTKELLLMLEPWCSTIYSTSDIMQEIHGELVNNTAYDLSNRLSSEEPTNDINIFIDGSTFTTQDLTYLHSISQILQQEKPQSGEFRLGSFTIKINNYKEYKYNPNN